MPPQTPVSQGTELSATQVKLNGTSSPPERAHNRSRDVSLTSATLQGSNDDNTTPSSTLPSTATVPDQRLIIAIRSVILMAILACYFWHDVIQGWVDVTWEYLRSAAWFTSVYFETWWATLSYAILFPIYPFAIHYVPFLDRYKVDPSVTYVHQTVLRILKEAIIYMTPLGLLDTVMVKKYCGVDPKEWDIRRQDWIQTTRALPLHPPTVAQLAYEVIGSIILYDALFFMIHLMLHKSRFLYKLLHALHHEHDIMHAHVTNQLTVGERIILVLAANQALKMLYSHPLSRAAFVPVFIFLLIDNHSGYDLPWGLQHIVPGQLMGGPRVHHAHHMQGTRHYQPFLTYLDSLLEWWEGRGRHRKKTC